MFGLKNINRSCFLATLRPLIFYARNPGLSVNLYGISLILKLLKVSLTPYFSLKTVKHDFCIIFPAVTRVGGNKKGVFTRSRQPKAVAHLLRKRYFALGREVDQCNFPEDLFLYITDAGSSRMGKHDDL